MVTTVSVPRNENGIGQSIDLYSSLYRPTGRRLTSAGALQPAQTEDMGELADSTAAAGGGGAPRAPPRRVPPLPASPPAPVRERGRSAGPPHHGRGHPAGPGIRT